MDSMNRNMVTILLGLALAAGCRAYEAPPKPPRPTPEVDDFGLPLRFKIEVPEVPEKIRGPSPPIEK